MSEIRTRRQRLACVDTVGMALLSEGGHLTPQVAAEEYAARRDAIRRQMVDRGLAALVVASPQNIYYLSGLNFLGYFAWPLLIVFADNPPVLVTRAMERPVVAAQVPHCAHVGYDDGADPSAAAARALGQGVPRGGTVGVESWYLPFAVAQHLPDLAPGLHWCDATNVVEQASVRKSTAEVAFIRRAAAISDVGMRDGLAVAAAGASDNDVAAAVYQAMVAAGSEYPAAPPIIRRTDIIDQDHVTWTGRRLRPGGGLFLELSASVGRYHAPLTRMAHIGPPSPQLEQAAEIALAGHDAVRKALRPGAVADEIYQVWEDIVGQDDTGPRPIHQHCGYLVGIGFPPTWMEGAPLIGLRPGGDLVVDEGMVFHLVSWVRYPTGYAVSDTALITADGCETLTATPRELTVRDEDTTATQMGRQISCSKMRRVHDEGRTAVGIHALWPDSLQHRGRTRCRKLDGRWWTTATTGGLHHRRSSERGDESSRWLW